MLRNIVGWRLGILEYIERFIWECNELIKARNRLHFEIKLNETTVVLSLVSFQCPASGCKIISSSIIFKHGRPLRICVAKCNEVNTTSSKCYVFNSINLPHQCVVFFPWFLSSIGGFNVISSFFFFPPDFAY